MPSDRQLFPALKRNLGCHKSAREPAAVIQWLITQNTDFYQQEIETFVPPYYKYFSFGGSYVEMWESSRVQYELFLLCKFVHITVKGSVAAASPFTVSPYKQLIFSTSKQFYTTTRVNLGLLKVYSLACRQDRKSTAKHFTDAFGKRNCK